MSGLDRVNLPNPSAIDRDGDRRHLQSQFERSMSWRSPDGSHEGGAGSGSDENDADRDNSSGSRYKSAGMQKEALSWLQRSLDRPDNADISGDEVTKLLLEISHAIRAGRKYSGDQWRLLVRVREELLARTEIEIAANGGRISVCMRTSCDISFRTIGASLGRLNSQLANMNLVEGGVKVFLVSVKDLP